MNKEQFLWELQNRLQALNYNEVQKVVAFYAESIDDRTDSGLTQEEAVAQLGNLNDIVAEIMADVATDGIQNEVSATGAQYKNGEVYAQGGQFNNNAQYQNSAQQKENSGSKALWVILAIVGFPIWGPLLIAAVAVVFSVFISIWAVVISLFTVPIVLLITGIALIVAMVGTFTINAFTSFALFGAALILVGISVLLFAAMVLVFKYTAKFTGFAAKGIAGIFSKKG